MVATTPVNLLPTQDSSLTINTPNPDFTSCFQQTVLLWTPCVFVVIATCLYMLYFRDYEPEELYGSITTLGYAKLVSYLAVDSAKTHSYRHAH